MPGIRGANRITGEGICLEGEPITSQVREYAWNKGSQSHHRGGNMPGRGANHITGVRREYAWKGSQSHHRGGNMPMKHSGGNRTIHSW
eukprot:1196208-Prorocentrum_minimum.AAC.4